jgi:hypothetical protein
MKEKDTVNEKADSPVLEMADLAMKNYQQALKTGLKLQEEAGRVCSSMFNQTASTVDYQKQFTQMTGVVNGMFSSAQKRSEEIFDLLEKTSRTSVDLAKKAFDAAYVPAIAEGQSKWLDIYKASLDTARQNAEAVTQISSRAFDSCIEFVRKNSEVRAEV